MVTQSFQGPDGSYEVVRVLGRGGFGTVYLARYAGAGGFNKEVAIKVLNPGMEGIEEVASRLRDEGRMLGLLRHRALVVVDRLTMVNGQWAVVMEFVEGADLRRLIKLAPVPARPAVEIVGEVAGALHVAYSRVGPSGEPLRLIHRDIKPSNIQITPYGEVKVLDFGIARAEFRGREGVTHSLRYGTPEYMSPERMDMVDGPEGDVYALGAVLYEALTGRLLGRTSSREDKHQVVVDVALHTLAERGVHREVVSLVRSLIAWDPSRRPSARELERRCGGLLDMLRDDPLREWAEAVVPAAPPEPAASESVSGGSHPNEAPRSDPSASSAPHSGGASHSQPTLHAQPQRPGTRTLLALGALFGLVGVGIGVGLWKTTHGDAAEPSAIGPVEAPNPVEPEKVEPEQVEPEKVEPAQVEAKSAKTTPVQPSAAKAPVPTRTRPTVVPSADPTPSDAAPTPSEPPAPVVISAVVSILGDATAVSLVSSSGTVYVLPRAVPTGTYAIKATFAGWGQVTAGRLVIGSADPVSLRCVSDTTTCAAR